MLAAPLHIVHGTYGPSPKAATSVRILAATALAAGRLGGTRMAAIAISMTSRAACDI